MIEVCRSRTVQSDQSDGTGDRCLRENHACPRRRALYSPKRKIPISWVFALTDSGELR